MPLRGEKKQATKWERAALAEESERRAHPAAAAPGQEEASGAGTRRQGPSTRGGSSIKAGKMLKYREDFRKGWKPPEGL